VRAKAELLQESTGFTGSYITRSFGSVAAAIARETEIKKWRREKKVALIARNNPTWEDLAIEWGQPAVLRVDSKAGSSPPLRAGSE
jgi:hypothetical protein